MAQEKFYFSNPRSFMKDFPEEKIMEIYKDYLNQDIPVKNTEEKYGLTPTPLRRFLPHILTDEECRHCKHKLYNKPPRDLTGPKFSRICGNCKHQLDRDTCSCPGCKNERELEARMLKEEMEKIKEQDLKEWVEFYTEEFGLYPKIEDLSIRDGILLAHLIERLYNEEHPNTLKLNSVLKKRPLWYGSYYTNELNENRNILSYLYGKNILMPSGEYAFVKDENGNVMFPKLVGEGCLVNIKNDDGSLMPSLEVFKELRSKEYTYEDKLYLMKEVYTAELRAKMNLESTKYLKDTFSEEMVLYYVELLFPKYSLAEAFQLVFYVVNNSLRFKTSRKPSSKAMFTYLKNEIVRIIERNSDSKKITTRSRDSELVLSYFSEYVLDKILNRKFNYFNLPIERLLSPKTDEEKTILNNFISQGQPIDSKPE